MALMEIKNLLGLIIIAILGVVFINIGYSTNSIFTQAFVLGGVVAIIVAGIGLYKEIFA